MCGYFCTVLCIAGVFNRRLQPHLSIIVYTIKTARSFMRLDVLHVIIFTSADCEPAHNDGCDALGRNNVG
jgi:hypothetical protein